MSAGGFETIESDVLVVGGGLAALRAALAARTAGARVLIAVKRKRPVSFGAAWGRAGARSRRHSWLAFDRVRS